MSKGSLVYPDGEKYFGELKDGVPHGEGTMTFPDGSKYVGAFLDGQFCGFGTFTTFSGTYEGEWRNGVPNGQGTFSYSDGSTQSGEWENGHFKGDDTPDTSNTQLSMLNEEEEEVYRSQPVVTKDLQQYIIYEENNVAPKETPQKDTWSYSRNTSSFDAVQESKFSTMHATVRLKEGLYTGELNKGIPHGKGSLVDSEGIKYIGHWQKGVMEGEFVVVGTDGKSSTCFYKQGVIQKAKKQIVVSFKLMPGRDNDLIEWLQNLGEGEKSFHIRQALRERLTGKKVY